MFFCSTAKHRAGWSSGTECSLRRGRMVHAAGDGGRDVSADADGGREAWTCDSARHAGAESHVLFTQPHPREPHGARPDGCAYTSQTTWPHHRASHWCTPAIRLMLLSVVVTFITVLSGAAKGGQPGICPPPLGLRQALGRECTHKADQGENGNLQ